LKTPRRKKLIRFFAIEILITLVFLSPFLIPRIWEIVEYRLPVSGYLPEHIAFKNDLYLRFACSPTAGDMIIGCYESDACVTKQFLVENNQWPLTEITSSTDVMAVMSPPVMSPYKGDNGKEVIIHRFERTIFVPYGEFCYIPYRNVFAP
jgi:hypothetical protein